MWFEFTASATSHELIVSYSETPPQALITTLQLFENKCPELHLRKEVTTQPPELPRMLADQLIVGEKYKVRAERVPGFETGNFKMCITRDEVGGGPSDKHISGHCAPATTPWENPTATTFLSLCSDYTRVGIGTDDPHHSLDVHGHIGLENHLIFNSTSTHGVINWPQNGSLYFRTNSTAGDISNSTNRMIITSDGKVGIGTDNPAKMLHVKTIHYVGGIGTPTSHYGLRLEDNNVESNQFKVTETSIWDIEPIAGIHKPLFFSAVNSDGTKTKILTLFKEGNVGIGTDDPQSPLHIFRNSPSTGQNELLKLSNHWISGTQNEPAIIFDNDGLGGTQPSIRWKVGARVSGTHFFRINFETTVSGTVVDKELFRISENGEVRICHVKASEFTVENVAGCDFVFGVDYRLASLKEVDTFIKTYNHLQGIPSAKEMQENGVEMGNLQMKLLQKVEELFLYSIQQEKTINEMRKEVDELKGRIKGLER